MAPELSRLAQKAYTNLTGRPPFEPREKLAPELVDRIDGLETKQLEQAELISKLAEQDTYLAASVRKLSGMLWVVGIISAAALLVALSALLR